MKSIFSDMVTAHKDRIFGLACHLLKTPAEAEEVVQESFLKLWQSLDNVDHERVLPWLIQVTRNACLDRLRRRQVVVMQQVSNGVPESVDTVNPESTLQQSDLQQSIQDAIQTLNEPARSLVVLRDIQGLSYDDLALSLNLNLAQVKVYLHRARKQLRHALAGELDYA